MHPSEREERTALCRTITGGVNLKTISTVFGSITNTCASTPRNGCCLGRPSYWRSDGGSPGLDFVLTKFIPRLRDEGVSEEAIQDLLVNNPRRFWVGE